MNFFHFVVQRPILFSMLFLGLAIGGFFAITQLSVDLLPTVNLPIVSVTVVNPGMGAEDVEELITRRLIRVFSDLEALDHIQTVSREGVSRITVEFEYGKIDIDVASIEVQRRINEVRSELPPTIEEPLVRKVDPAARPILTLAFSDQEMTPRALRDFAENRLRRRLEIVDGVARVHVTGGLIRQINVHVDRARMEAYGITLPDISRILQSHNANIPAGALRMEDSATEIVVRTQSQFEDITEMRKLVLASRQGRPVLLEDVAAVVDSWREPRGTASLDGKPAISIQVQKQTGTNTVEVAKGVRGAVREIEADLPSGATLVIVRDDSEFIHRAIRGISDSAWQGFLLAFIAIFFLLGRFRPAIVIFISVPISIVTTFLVMFAADLNINMVTLYALTLSIGVNFDASVVILENIFRHLQEGKNRLDAAANSVQELMAPLFASTLTNVIVFLPLTQLQGYIGELMRAMALTAITAQVMALPVALLLTSNLTPRIVPKAPEGVSTIPGLTWLLRGSTGGVEWLARVYESMMPKLLKHRGKVILITLGILMASFGLVPFIGIEFMPRSDQNEFFIDLETPVGTTLEETHEVVGHIEKILLEMEELQHQVSTIGGDDPMDPEPHQANITVKLVSLTKRNRSAVDTGNPRRDIISGLRERITSEVPGIAYIQFVQPAPWWGSAGAPIEINLQGFDQELLEESAQKFVEALSGLKGVFDVRADTRPGKEEVLLRFDQARVSALGLTVGELAQQLRLAIHGGDTVQLRTEFRLRSLFRDRDVWVVVRLDPKDRGTVEDLMNLRIPTPSGHAVPLSSIATIETEMGMSHISGYDRQRRVLVTVQTSNEPLNQLVFQRVIPAVNSVKLPPGVTMTLSGEVTRMNDQFSGMAIGFGIAFLFVFMVLAGQFESFVHPLVMLSAIPVMMIGVFVALFLTGQTLNTTSGNGIFALMGVVVNTSVILIDYINILRKRGLERNKAIIEAGKTRLRPILMTVLTTFFAMVPMALASAEGSEIYKPLAIAFLGGIVSSTILTLVIIPVLYAFADDLTGKRGKPKPA